MSRGFTRKPCPVCGNPEYRPANQLCRECQTTYNIGKRVEEAQQSRPPGTIVVTQPEASHWMSRPYLFGIPGTASLLSEAWFELTNSVLDPALPEAEAVPLVTDKTDKTDGWGLKNSSRGKDFTVRARTRDAINRLDTIIRIALEVAFHEGEAKGLSLMRQLSTGALSTADYDDRIERNRKRVADLEAGIRKQQGKQIPEDSEDREDDEDN
jgi:hypothetical protein